MHSCRRNKVRSVFYIQLSKVFSYDRNECSISDTSSLCDLENILFSNNKRTLHPHYTFHINICKRNLKLQDEIESLIASVPRLYTHSNCSFKILFLNKNGWKSLTPFHSLWTTYLNYKYILDIQKKTEKWNDCYAE